MADEININQNDDVNIARCKRLEKVVLFFAVTFFAVLMLFTATAYPSPTEAKCRFRAAPFAMALCAGLIDLLVIVTTSVTLIQVLVQLRDGGVVRIGFVVAGNVVVAACLAAFLWLIWEFPCRGLKK